ncbi:hypothetical protein [Maribacter spongiicola]|uniref:hypothetical protein n=1 Tax=Maribacter spongiicola TaxID=1206753 RepID=UPI003F950479
MKNNIWLLAIILLGIHSIQAQGPPITADKPIMLGQGSFTLRTLAEIRTTERATFTYIPINFSYLPTSNIELAVEIPYLVNTVTEGTSKSALADIKLMGKYQFFRKDATGKTFRIVGKTIQTLPTGEDLDAMDLSTGNYAGYYGVVAGYETLKYGISNEIGYNWMPDGTRDDFRYKLGFGLPLLKPQYPNKQINLFFEYTNLWLVERNWYQLLYAQGVQYARKNTTFELAVQVPLVNDVDEGRKFKHSIFLGSRFTF